MSSHGSHQHRRAARAWFRRKPTKIHVLEERFSPTAIFPGMTDTPDPDPADPFTIFFPPDGNGIGHGHHKTPETTPTPEVPVTPVPPATSTPTLIPQITTSSIPTTTSVAIPTIPTTSSKVPTISTSITSSNSVVPATITLATTASRSPSSATPSASNTAASSSSGVSTGAIVGGIGAGIVAVAAIGFAVAFFIRRVRKRETDEAAGFDPRDFRRSAVMLQDPPTHEDTVARGYNPPPPPSMMQQHQHAPASTSTWGYTVPYYGEAEPGYGTFSQYQEQYPPYAAGQVSNSNSPPPTATTAQPMLPAHHAQNPFSPTSSVPSLSESPVTPFLTRQISNNTKDTHSPAQSPPMTRQVTVAPYPSLERRPSTRSTQIPADDYVDLNRSSVSPFQAAQYAEISRRLNSLPSPGESSLASPAQLYATQQKDLPPVPPAPAAQNATISAGPAASPFRDPEPVAQVPIHSGPVHPVSATAKVEVVPIPEPVALPPAAAAPVQAPSSPAPSTLNVQTVHIPTLSSDSLSQEELEFPVPPSPALSYSSRYRVESLPPTLPEIRVQERSSVSSYIPRSPMIGTGYISGMSGISDLSGVSGVNSMGLQPVGPRSEGKFVPTPSPLASSFAVESPTEGQESMFAEAQKKAVQDTSSGAITTQTAGSSATDSEKSNGKRPNTVYDLDDAYGGI